MTRHFKGGGLTGGQVHQGVTGPSASVTPAPGPPKPQPGPWSPQQTLNFVGTLTNGIKSAPFSFNVLAGHGAPTITGGWAKINTVDRARTLGFTIPAGFDPMTMDVPIQFEGVAKYSDSEPDIEGDIQKLEWMAGRGKLFASQRITG